MLTFLFGPVLIWAPKIFFLGMFVCGVSWYVFRNRGNFELQYFSLKKLIWWAIIFRVGYAAIATWGQYHIWAGQELTQLLLPPHQSISYFLGYVGLRLWLNVGLSIGLSYLFYKFLERLRLRNERFFEDGEVQFGWLMALVVGWPGFILLIPFIFGSVILVSLVRIIVFRKQFTTLGWPILVATAAVLLWGKPLLDLFNLEAFKI